MRRFLLIVVPLFLVASACGGDDGGGGLGSGGLGGGDFCDLIRSFDEEQSDSEELTSPDEFEAAFKEMRSQLDAAASSAPVEIRADVEKVRDGISVFFELLEENDWDIFALAFASADDPRLAALEDPDFEAAGERVEEFCGIDSDSSSDGFDSGFGDEDLPDGDDLPDIDLGDFEPSDLDFDITDENEIMVQTWMIFGHDRQTAECLADELGDFDGGTDFDVTAEVCGMTMLEAITGGG